MPLKVIIVGAGLAGLATAIGFARHGHHVQVFERHSPSNREESGSGIQFQPNINLILERWDMLDEITKVAHDNEKIDMRTADGKSIVAIDLSEKGHAWYSLRRAYKDLFREHALRLGVEVREGASVQRIDVRRPAIWLQDGSCIEGDLIVGADGSGSRVRSEIFPDYAPSVQTQACFQVVLPLETVQNDPEMQSMISGPHAIVTISSGRSIFASPAPHQRSYDMQFTDHEYGLEQDSQGHGGNARLSDISTLRERFNDHGRAYRKALEVADTAFKWRFVETYGLPSWSSANGKVVLLGDCTHAMTPFSGQGAAMGIEDAAVLSELLSKASPADNLAEKLALFEKLRRPRAEKVQDLARVYGKAWAASDPRFIKVRDERWRKINENRYGDAKPDMNAVFFSPAFNKWLDHYNVFEEVGKVESAQAKL